MVKLNGNYFTLKTYPDNTLNFIDFDPTKYFNCFPEDHIYTNVLYGEQSIFISNNEEKTFKFEWIYDANSGESDFLTIFYIKRWLDNNPNFNKNKTALYLYYVPQARMDRVKNSTEIFTLKYFAELINFLNFNEVNIFDPHSNVTPALINNVKLIDVNEFHSNVLNKLLRYYPKEDIILYFPDEGAMKRYSEEESFKPYQKMFGFKNRDWKTGKIQGIQLVGDAALLNNKVILIVDDICSYGGTFYYSAIELKKYNPKNIYLAVSHCEESIFKGKLYAEKLVDKVFTSRSIFRKNEDTSFVEKVI